MVQGQRLLVVLALAAGCKAETLGVDVPRGGPQAISHEDLQRDVWALEEPALKGRALGTPGGVEALSRASQRFQQMHLLPAFGDSYERPGGVLCGLKDGRSGEGVLVAAEDPGSGASGAAAVAALISLAKAFDVPSPPTHTLVLCAWPATGGLDAYLSQPAFPLAYTLAVILLGPLSGEIRESAADPLGPAPVTRLAGQAPTEGDSMDRLDFRALAETVRALHARVVAIDGGGG